MRSHYTERVRGMYCKKPQLLGSICVHNLPVQTLSYRPYSLYRRRHIVAICYSKHLSAYTYMRERKQDEDKCILNVCWFF